MLPEEAEERELYEALHYWFMSRGIADAVYGLEYDDNGYFAIINDEAFDSRWGKSIF